MKYLSYLDCGIILAYFVVLVGIGRYLKKRASASLSDYFLGGRRIPWWLLGISGMAAWVDMTGTMIITSFLFMLGPRGLFVEFRGGAGLVLIFVLLWLGKWHRRSGCLTGAEWMTFRFGDGFGGNFAKLASVVSDDNFCNRAVGVCICGGGIVSFNVFTVPAMGMLAGFTDRYDGIYDGGWFLWCGNRGCFPDEHCGICCDFYNDHGDGQNVGQRRFRRNCHASYR